MFTVIDFLRSVIRVTSSVPTDEFGGYIITRPRAERIDNVLVYVYVTITDHLYNRRNG